VFDLLRVVITRDIDNLKSQGFVVFRPAVFFITDGEPTDDPAWENSYRALMDPNSFKRYPNIIAFGVNGANAVTIGKIGTVGAFIGDSGVSPADSLSEIMKSLTNSIMNSSNASTPALVLPDAPVGTTQVALQQMD